MDSAPNPDTKEPTVLVSMIQHYLYCPRQCALIHLEQVFDENLFTLRGRRAHQRVDEPSSEVRGEVRQERALPLWSDELGLRGKADLVEFHPDRILPVEYKSGPRRERQADEAQLCAQALCLEEMLDAQISHGAIYHAASSSRREVAFGPELRQLTVHTIEQVREMLRRRRLPAAPDDGRCRHCSLRQACLPQLRGQASQARQYLEHLFRP